MKPKLRLIALALVLLAAFAPPADARYSRKKAIWGPTQVNGVSQFPIYRDLGVGIFQMQLSWNQVAPDPASSIPDDPTDPAYRWPAEVDFAIREARRSRIRVSLMVRGTPPWANGGRSAEWAPTKARDFAAFARAAARRYPASAPVADLGRAVASRPTSSHCRVSRRRARAAMPDILDAAYGSLKRESRRNLVIGGNTFTTGDVSPRQFIRSMRLPNGRAPADGPIRPQPIHAAPACAAAGSAGPRLCRLLGSRHTRRVDRSEPRSGAMGGRSACSCRSSRFRPITRTTSSTSGSRGGYRRAGSAGTPNHAPTETDIHARLARAIRRAAERSRRSPATK